jgi:hypothetical protein
MTLRRNLLRRVAKWLDCKSDASGGSAMAPGGFGESSTGLGMKQDLVGEDLRIE